MEDYDLFEDSIILIGPSGIGKSTVGRELSRITNMRQVSLDPIANHEKELRKKFPSSDDYKLNLLRRLIETAKEEKFYGVVDFGAGYSIFDREDKILEAQELLGNFKNIILLKYSDDIEESLREINRRSTGDTEENFYFLTCGCNERLATDIVYTKDKKPEEIAKEIEEITKKKSNVR